MSNMKVRKLLDAGDEAVRADVESAADQLRAEIAALSDQLVELRAFWIDQLQRELKLRDTQLEHEHVDIWSALRNLTKAMELLRQQLKEQQIAGELLKQAEASS